METIYLRDLDGTGSMHPCYKEDFGAVAYIPYQIANELADALTHIRDIGTPDCERYVKIADDLAVEALIKWEVFKHEQSS